MNTKKGNIVLTLIPLMLAFFVMGFVDLVGVATNYIKTDFDLSEKLANLLPSMVFFWFLVLSVPTGLLMNRIGRRKTVIISMAITALALIVPYIGYSFGWMMVSFCLLGIGNTLLQVSLNPLMSNVVSHDKLASNLTLGQFVKAIASFLAPIIAGWAAKQFGDWKLLFPIFMAVSLLATLLLGMTRIKEDEEPGKGAGFLECFSLLGDKVILLLFFGIICHVGIDVGVNITLPKLFMERFAMPREDAGYTTSLYFLFRTIGCFAGAFILARYSARMFFMVSIAMLLAGVAGLMFFESETPLYVGIALMGMGNSNVFSIIISRAMLYVPDKKNEVSGLMIMGLVGGTIFPLIMGYLADMVGSQQGALIVIAVGILYLLLLSFRMKK